MLFLFYFIHFRLKYINDINFLLNHITYYVTFNVNFVSYNLIIIYTQFKKIKNKYENFRKKQSRKCKNSI